MQFYSNRDYKNAFRKYHFNWKIKSACLFKMVKANLLEFWNRNRVKKMKWKFNLRKLNKMLKILTNKSRNWAHRLANNLKRSCHQRRSRVLMQIK